MIWKLFESYFSCLNFNIGTKSSTFGLECLGSMIIVYARLYLRYLSPFQSIHPFLLHFYQEVFIFSFFLLNERFLTRFYICAWVSSNDHTRVFVTNFLFVRLFNIRRTNCWGCRGRLPSSGSSSGSTGPAQQQHLTELFYLKERQMVIMISMAAKNVLNHKGSFINVDDCVEPPE